MLLLISLGYTKTKKSGKTLKTIKFLLLLSLFFNIAHASIITMQEECHHTTFAEYMIEEKIADECGDLCDTHHFFHFIAILLSSNIDLDSVIFKEQSTQKTLFYHPPFKVNHSKPPIV